MKLHQTNNVAMKCMMGGLVSILCSCGGIVDHGDQRSDKSANTIYIPFVSMPETPVTETMYGYTVTNFLREERDTIRQTIWDLSVSFWNMSRLVEITKDPAANNAYFSRGDNKIHIDLKTISDGTLAYVLTHEMSHVWSYQHGSYTYLGFDNSRHVGPDFAGGYLFANDIFGYERCYPCAKNITQLSKCYAASNAEAALAMGPALDPQGWANMMGGVDEDFCETVSAYYSKLTDIAWVDQDLQPCTPTVRYDWLNQYLDNPPNRSIATGKESTDTEAITDKDMLDIIDKATLDRSR